MHSSYPDGMPKLLTVGEVAAWLKVHPNTIRRRSERGLLKTYRIEPRRDRRFARTEVEQLLVSGLADDD